ncbi:MAG: hypothetical protein K2P78_02440 [Gemmataceae bacterium]|nr:hypothetical protein [Gemmataceae bacterium]
MYGPPGSPRSGGPAGAAGRYDHRVAVAARVRYEYAREVRNHADRHALRPAGTDEALPFDDPAKDPYRWAALAYLRKKLDEK